MEQSESTHTLEKLKIHDRLLSVEEKVTRIYSWVGGEFGYDNQTEGNTVRHMREIKESINEVANLVKKQNGRISKLENWRAGIVGVLGFIGFTFPVMTGLLVYFLK